LRRRWLECDVCGRLVGGDEAVHQLRSVGSERPAVRVIGHVWCIRRLAEDARRQGVEVVDRVVRDRGVNGA